MKLSERGVKKVLDELEASEAIGDVFEPAEIEFEQTDFTCGVWLTNKEADMIVHCFQVFQKHFKLFEPELKVWRTVKERLEEGMK